MGQSLCLQWIGSAGCVTSVGVLCLCVGKLFWFGDILREQLALLVHVCWGEWFLWAHKHLLEALERNKLLKSVFLS